LKRVVKRTEKDREMACAVLNQMKKQLVNRREYLDEVLTRKRELVEKKREILDSKYTAEERANEKDRRYLAEQEREIQLNSELKSTSERMYKITQEIFDYKKKERSLEADVNGSVVTMSNLQAKTNKLDHESLKQQEVLYHQVGVHEID
jgi:coiled-coil domain-containing protein 39